MPRASKEQSTRNHARIEETASRLFRERGVNGISVADLMQAAGLTHGGFYGHFASKDELVAAACTHAFAQSIERWQSRIQKKPAGTKALHALVDPYLTPRMVDQVGNGCPAVALAADVIREPLEKPVRTAYLEGSKDLIDLLTSASTIRDADKRRKKALVQWSTMVGALLLARATQGDDLSDEILSAVREQLLAE
ncbi:TetR/AcrR family transcriptional regulator [uncultured Oxalicibacterium sp.]|uniref:TetR/AcrR family transcriptional regulator n=1 Tax=uncultured Oxalicibacterium sp. TaxID=1168540 RepID=UPI0025DA02F7|nr:TetR/AcrR family transcriptional regulator [uncultured Oxalicibacterium sp.]